MAVFGGDIRKRMKLLLDGQPCLVVDADVVKPGKGQAFTRVKTKNLITNRIIERTFKSNESVDTATVTTINMEYLYNDGDHYTFMNSENYEQVDVAGDLIEEERKWLKENCICEVSFWENKIISVVPPIFMEYEITHAEPAVRGDTATNITKKATIETGTEINVPLFVNEGTRVQVDTRTGEYLKRVDK